jgi:hypothetical protein
MKIRIFGLYNPDNPRIEAILRTLPPKERLRVVLRFHEDRIRLGLADLLVPTAMRLSHRLGLFLVGILIKK